MTDVDGNGAELFDVADDVVLVEQSSLDPIIQGIDSRESLWVSETEEFIHRPYLMEGEDSDRSWPSSTLERCFSPMGLKDRL